MNNINAFKMDIGCGMELQFSEASNLNEPDFAGTGSGITVNLESSSDDVRHLLDSVTSTCTSTTCRGHYQSDRHLSVADFKLDLGPANDLVSAAELSMENSVTDISDSMMITEECSDGYSIVNAALEGNVAPVKPQMAAPCTVNLSGIPLTTVLSGIHAIPVIPITNLQNVQLCSDGKMVKINGLQLVTDVDKLQTDAKNSDVGQSAVLLGNVVMLHPVTGQVISTVQGKPAVDSSHLGIGTGHNYHSLDIIGQSSSVNSSVLLEASSPSIHVENQNVNVVTTDKPAIISSSDCSQCLNSVLPNTSTSTANDRSTSHPLILPTPSTNLTSVTNNQTNLNIENAMTLKKCDMSKQCRKDDGPRDPLERTKIMTCGKTIYLTFDCKSQNKMAQEQLLCGTKLKTLSNPGEKVLMKSSLASESSCSSIQTLEAVKEKSSSRIGSVSSVSVEMPKTLPSLETTVTRQNESIPSTDSIRQPTFPIPTSVVSSSTVSLSSSGINQSTVPLSTSTIHLSTISESVSSVNHYTIPVSSSTIHPSAVNTFNQSTVPVSTCIVQPSVHVLPNTRYSSTVPVSTNTMDSSTVSVSAMTMDQQLIPVTTNSRNISTVPVSANVIGTSTNFKNQQGVPVSMNSADQTVPVSTNLGNHSTGSAVLNLRNSTKVLVSKNVSCQPKISISKVAESNLTVPVSTNLRNHTAVPETKTIMGQWMVPVSQNLRNPSSVPVSLNHLASTLSANLVYQPLVSAPTNVNLSSAIPISTNHLPGSVSTDGRFISAFPVPSNTSNISTFQVLSDTTNSYPVPVLSSLTNSSTVPLLSNLTNSPTVPLLSSVTSSPTVPLLSSMMDSSSTTLSPTVPLLSSTILAPTVPLTNSPTVPVLPNMTKLPTVSLLSNMTNFPTVSMLSNITNSQTVPVLSSVIHSQTVPPLSRVTNSLTVPVLSSMTNSSTIQCLSNVTNSLKNPFLSSIKNSPVVSELSTVTNSSMIPVLSSMTNSSAVQFSSNMTNSSAVPVLSSMTNSSTVSVLSSMTNSSAVQLSSNMTNSSAFPVLSNMTNSSTVPVLSSLTNSSTVPVLSNLTNSSTVPVLSSLTNSSTVPVLSNLTNSSAVPVLSSLTNSSTVPVLSSMTNLSAVPLLSSVTNSSVVPVLSSMTNSSTVPVLSSLTNSSTIPVLPGVTNSSTIPVLPGVTNSATVPVLANVISPSKISTARDLIVQSTVLPKNLQNQPVCPKTSNVINRAIIVAGQSKGSVITNPNNLPIFHCSGNQPQTTSLSSVIYQQPVQAPINVANETLVLGGGKYSVSHGKIIPATMINPQRATNSTVQPEKPDVIFVPQVDTTKYISILGAAKKQKLNTDTDNIQSSIMLQVKNSNYQSEYQVTTQTKTNVETLENVVLSGVHSTESASDKNSKLINTSAINLISNETGQPLDKPKLDTQFEFLGGDKPYKCDLCSAAFNRMGNYTRHRMIHTINTKDSYRYKCDECGRLFLQRCDMKRHMLIHTNQQPYRCQDCGKGYIRRSDLVVHMRFHRKERAFKCQRCSKEFFQSGDLNRHIRHVHLQSSLLTCGHCSRQFAKESTLIRHMQIKHRDIIIKSLKKKNVNKDSDSVKDANNDVEDDQTMDSDTSENEMKLVSDSEFLDENVNVKIEGKLNGNTALNLHPSTE